MKGKKKKKRKPSPSSSQKKDLSQTPTLSLCMIARDEEHNLRRALASVKGVADEIIVVDTGSVDRTPDIAREMGAWVYFYPWDGSFATATNYCLDQARGHWILILDADEEIHHQDRKKLIPFLKQNQAEGYIVNIISYLGKEPGSNVYCSTGLRLFRNRKEYRYERALHQQLGNIDPNACALLQDFRILHYGYLDSEVARKNKPQRNLEVLQEDLKQRAPNAADYYYLGQEYAHQNRYEEAVEQFRKAKPDIQNFPAQASQLVRYLSFSLLQLGDWLDAEKELQEGLTLFPDFTDLYYYQGFICHEQGRYQEAAAALEKVLTLGTPPVQYCSEQGLITYQTAYLLGKSLVKLRRYQEAIAAFKKSFRFNPDYYPALYPLASLLFALQGEEEAARDLEELVAPPSPLSHLALADVFMAVERYGPALEVLNRLPSELPPSLEPKARYLNGLVRFKKGDYREALPYWEGLPPNHDFSVPLGPYLAWIYWSQGNPRQALDILAPLPCHPEIFEVLARSFGSEALGMAAAGMSALPEAPFFSRFRSFLQEKEA